jgi:hypothetical protein
MIREANVFVFNTKKNSKYPTKKITSVKITTAIDTYDHLNRKSTPGIINAKNKKSIPSLKMSF